MIDFNYIREHGLLLYEYIRGSKLYGIDRPESDEDHGGIYIEPQDSLLGTIPFPEEINDETNDESWFSLGKFLSLLTNSNPNVLEALFVPEDKIIYKHPVMDIILKERDKFISKRCFSSFTGYSRTQIEKARSLKKKITQPMDGPLQSCLGFIMYVNDDGGSSKVVDWLASKGLNQRYCGLVNVDKMPTVYCMYYDWGEHLYVDCKVETWEQFKALVDSGKEVNPFVMSLLHYAVVQGYDVYTYYSKGEYDILDINTTALRKFWDKYKTPMGFRGLVNRNNTSNEVRFSSSSSIPKGEKYILVVSYNGDGYSTYCRQWREYNDFEKHHNVERFNLAKEKQFDRKNMTHSARLVSMGIEIAKGQGVLVDRTNIDREFLLKIRTGNMTYEEIMDWLSKKKKEMEDAMEKSTIPEDIDQEFLNDISIKMRRVFYNVP